MPRINSPVELEAFRKKILSERDPEMPCITLCSGTACHATGSKEVALAIEEELENQGMADTVHFRRTGCHGFCAACVFHYGANQRPPLYEEACWSLWIVRQLRSRTAARCLEPTMLDRRSFSSRLERPPAGAMQRE